MSSYSRRATLYRPLYCAGVSVTGWRVPTYSRPFAEMNVTVPVASSPAETVMVSPVSAVAVREMVCVWPS